MYEDKVKQFADAMQHELDENRHKVGWQWCKISWLRHRLKQEIGELELAIAGKKPAELVLSEAADVANFAMMIADNYARQGARRRGEDGTVLR